MRILGIWLALVVAAGLSLTACTEDESAPEETPTVSGTCEYRPFDDNPGEADLPRAEPQWSGDVDVTVRTNLGDFAMTVHADDAPCTANAFLSLVEQRFYHFVDCHRLTSGWLNVLQCGDPRGDGRGGPGYRYDEEVTGNEEYVAGAVAMARTDEPGTSGSQFFMVHQDSVELEPDFTIFATVSEGGLDVLRQIAMRGTQTGQADGQPALPVTIYRIDIALQPEPVMDDPAEDIGSTP